MVVFLFLGLMFFFSGLLFCFFVGVYLFIGLNCFCWGGYFVFFDSYVYVVLVFMSLFILGLVVMSELNLVLVFFSELLVLVCLFFFFSVNMLMLYIFFELSIFPILVMILGYGSQVEKVGSSYYLVFYAVVCSSPFLYVYFCRSFFLLFAYYDLFVSWEVLFFLTLCFLVKFPVYFLHLWLPKAHVEAPTTARMLLAGLLLKLGTIGYMRLMVMYNYVFFWFWGVVALLGMVLGSFLCLLQSDVKSLVAYSSIVHMGFVLFVFFVIYGFSKVGGCLIMVSHGYVSTMIFYLVGEFFHVSGTRIVNFLGGLILSGVIFGYFFILVFLCNGGLPPSLSFFSEFLGVVGFYLGLGGVLVFLFLYFFVGFYFSLFILTGSLMGVGFVGFSVWFVVYMIPGVILMFDFF